MCLQVDGSVYLKLVANEIGVYLPEIAAVTLADTKLFVSEY
jgi:hypothetical protein